MLIPNSYTILSIDPGTNTLGWALSEYTENQLIVEKFGTLYPTQYPKGSVIRGHNKNYSDRIIAGRVIRNWLKTMVLEYQPDFICSEDAFYNPSRPNAYASLLIAIYSMESQLYSMYANNSIDQVQQAKIYKIAPTTIKMIIHDHLTDIGGTADKKDMTHALKQRVQNKEIILKGYKKFPAIEEITEHSTDAICGGYAFVKLWKPLIDENILEPRMTAFTRTVRKLLKKKKYKSPYLK